MKCMDKWMNEINGWNEGTKWRMRIYEIDENSVMWRNSTLWWKFVANKEIHLYTQAGDGSKTA